MPSYGAETPKEIIVSAAISLKDAFIEIGELHEERTGVKVNFNFGASGILQKQIDQNKRMMGKMTDIEPG